MAIRINCPSCKAPLGVPDDMRGRRVRCGKCNETITVPGEEALKPKRAEEAAIQEDRKVKVKSAGSPRSRDDDDDRRTPRKKAKASASGVPILLLVGGGAAVLLFLLLGVGGLAALFLFRSEADHRHVKVEVNKQANNDGELKDNRPEPEPIVDPNAGKPLPEQMTPLLVQRVKQATVYLRVEMPSGQVAEGSGFFAVEPGIVITNAHVLGMLQAKSKVPNNVQVVVNSGEANVRKMVGQVLGVDRGSDLAVVRVNEGNLPEPLILEASRQLTETQKVYIFGFPFGEQLGENITVSESSVSSLRRKAGVLDQIQVNGGMHPGNSGGPVVNSFGNVIGVSVAGIKGTQINFAVPADFVRLVMEGRLADAKHGEVYAQGGQLRLPVQYTCLDPLNRVRELQVEVWTGSAGQPRPYSTKRPEAMPGDGPRQAHAIAYRDSAGKLDVPLPPLDAGQVYWLQPVIKTSKGSTHWGTAVAASISLMPIERKTANLKVSLTAELARTIKVNSSSSVTLLKGKEKKIFADKMYAEILEELSSDPKGALMRTGIGKASFTGEEDGRSVGISPQVPSYLRGMPPVFVIDDTNKMRERADRNLGPSISALLREQIQDAYTQLCNSIEAVTLPMPNRMVEPMESWQTEVPMLLRTGKGAEVVDLALTCTLEGTRTRNQRSEAVISVIGRVKGRDANANKIGGDITGKLAFDLTAGFIADAQLNISTEREILGGELQAIYAFDIDLKRQPGNPTNIVMPVVNKSDPGPIAKGRVILNQNGALTPGDPPDPSPRGQSVKARMKLHQLNLEAGKTYVILLHSDAFDSFLRLESPAGAKIMEDDDGGGFPNARIEFRPPNPGTYRIVVTSFDGKVGPYRLSVMEGGGGNLNPFPIPNPNPLPVPKIGPQNPKPGEFPASALFAKPAKSPAPTSYLKIESPKGDYIGQGKNYDYTGNQMKAKRIPRGMHISVEGWGLDIGAPNGQFLQVGEYTDAKRFAFSGASPGLDFSGNGRGSNSLAGEFVVWELELNGDQVVRAAIDFVQRSEIKGPPLRGKLRINSNLE